LQEALTNILRHSGARRVVIRTPVSGSGVGLVVEDDGVGFDPSAVGPPHGGIGLTNIRRSLDLVGGRFQLESAPGHGTRLSVFLPAPASP
jgi:signal transduction histidine kinase